MLYIIDKSLNGVLSAVYDAYSLHQLPEGVVGKGDQLPLFCDDTHQVSTAENRAQRVWAGLEKRLSKQGLHTMVVSSLSCKSEVYTHLFNYIYKVFQRSEGAASIERNFSDPDVLAITQICRQVMHERLHVMQFIRFQKAKDGTYLGVMSPDNDVIPLAIEHFADRFGDQPFLLFDAKRKYGYFYEKKETTRVTFEDSSTLPFDLSTGQLNDDVLSNDDKLFQELWQTYFKAICIRERLNPKKQLNDMPRRYWRYMTEKQAKKK